MFQTYRVTVRTRSHLKKLKPSIAKEFERGGYEVMETRNLSSAAKQ
jgi:hypothetical protein